MNMFYVNVSKKELQMLNPVILHTFSICHNLFLQLFSFYSFIYDQTIWAYL